MKINISKMAEVKARSAETDKCIVCRSPVKHKNGSYRHIDYMQSLPQEFKVLDGGWTLPGLFSGTLSF